MIEILYLIATAAILFTTAKLGFGLYHFIATGRKIWRYLSEMAKEHELRHIDRFENQPYEQMAKHAAETKLKKVTHDSEIEQAITVSEESATEELAAIDNELMGLDQGQPGIYDSLDRVRDLHARKADIIEANPHLRGR